jgi:pimeloyl-[acyl-carrier protein] methyl ester esterase
VGLVTSMLDALGLERARIVGTSLGAMWGLCMALDRPERVISVVGLGIPAVSLPGMRGNAFFRALTTPGVRAVVRRIPPPKSLAATRRGSRDAMGRHAVDRMPDAYFDVMRATMLMPGWRTAMYTHLNLAMRSGKPRPENLFTDAELASIQVPVRFVFGDADVYGGPEVGERAVRLMPDARLDVVPGGHAPFVDEPERCAEVIRAAP